MDIYIGVDDTDSIKGMCTTYLATELIKEFGELDLIGNPRLVRLNPNVPWKTRGNGAVALRFGKGRGKPKNIGMIDSTSINCYQTGYPTPPEEGHFKRAREVLESLAVFDDDNTNPGIVMMAKKPPSSLYWTAVRQLTNIDEHFSKANADFMQGYKNKRGLIGALSAIAWHPRDRTYELISYREKEKWGKSREIDAESVKRMDKKIKTTFNNYDYEEDHLAIAPNSPCPILYGIRGDVETDLEKASKIVRSENKARMITYLTNQGTDDHITKASISKLEPFTSVKVRGTVSSRPRKITGGHLIFCLTNGMQTVDCTIYEPAKGFRNTGIALMPGDRLVVYGGVREKPFTINVEKLYVDTLAIISEKSANPMCAKCNKRMKSMGKGQGYRCAICGAKAKEGQAEFSVYERDLKTGWFEPPVGSRRHLAKPLKRLQKENHRLTAIWASNCSEKVLSYFEEICPEDDRPRKAIEAARAWACGNLTVTEARKAAFASNAAARDTNDKAAQYAARSAGHAAATAHVVGHAPHAAAYAAKAANIFSSK